MNNRAIDTILKENPLIPVVTFYEGDDPIALMEYLLRKKVFCIEITLRTTHGLKAIEIIKEYYKEKVKVGAGTVISPEQIDQLNQVGVDFIVSPGLTEKLWEHMKDSGIPCLPGVSTPSEMMKAQEFGLEYLKFFPAHLYGGLSALKMFGGLFPKVKFCPTGGINETTSKEYLRLKNVVAVGGSWFQKEFKKIDKGI